MLSIIVRRVITKVVEKIIAGSLNLALFAADSGNPGKVLAHTHLFGFIPVGNVDPSVPNRDKLCTHHRLGYFLNTPSGDRQNEGGWLTDGIVVRQKRLDDVHVAWNGGILLASSVDRIQSRDANLL